MEDGKMVKVRNNEIAVAGRASGLWNKESRAFEVKRGMTKNGKKYQIFEMSVSKKDQEGNWTNGKGLKVMLWGDTKVDHNQSIGILGKLEPDNYENKEGKTVYGLQITAFETFEPDAWESGNSQSKAEAKDDEMPWDA